MRRLTGSIQNYAWGSTSLLADLRGQAASGDPEAEIWYGAHPGAGTFFDDGTSLLAEIDADPAAALGAGMVDRFGAKLPFLLKLLAAGSPLSIQAHPSIDQARAGFAAEEAAGINRSSPNRSFRDDNHKPELICAITPFEALVGFRPVDATLNFFESLGFTALNGRLRDTGPKGVVEGVLDPARWQMEDLEIIELVVGLVGACEHYDGEWASEAALLRRLDAQYPGDPGVIVAALLNYLTLEPGQALYLGAGNMHAYVGGLGVEIMANSDNVLRGGLTPKHIDVPNLLDVVLPDTITPELVTIDDEGNYLTPAPEFTLRRLELSEQPKVVGPSIILSTESGVLIDDGENQLELAATEAAWLAVEEQAVVSGSGTAWLASVNVATTLDDG